MEGKRIPKKILTYNPKRKRNIGRPQLRWRDHHTLQKDGKTTNGLFHEDDGGLRKTTKIIRQVASASAKIQVCQNHYRFNKLSRGLD
jgi:hypothetical protein